MTQMPPLPSAGPSVGGSGSRGIPGWALALIIGGAVLVVICVIALLVAILMPSLSRAKQLAMTTICQTNLQTIHSGMRMYLAEHDALPPDVDTLVRLNLVSPQALQCRGPGDGPPGRYCVHFPAGEPEKIDGRTLVACDLKGNHPDGMRNVLGYGGRGGYMDSRQFQAELQHPRNAEFAKALREKEGP